MENLSRIHDINGKREEELSKVNKKNIQKGFVQAHKSQDGKYWASFAVWGDNHSIEHIFNKKIHKLNEPHFQRFMENNLFIHAWLIDEDELNQGMEYIIRNPYQHTDLVYYDIVYIFTEQKLFYINDGCIDLIDIPDKILGEISQKSFSRVMKMTREENCYRKESR